MGIVHRPSYAQSRSICSTSSHDATQAQRHWLPAEPCVKLNHRQLNNADERVAIVRLVLNLSPSALRHPFRGRRRMLRTLGPDLAVMTAWSTTDAELQSEMIEAFNDTQQIGKLAHYLPIYESVIDRTKPIRMLKIGSFYTESVRGWQEYLHPNSHIVGVDSNSKMLKIADSEGIHVRIASEEGSVAFLKEVAAEFGPFDVIVDDGSHTSSHMVDSFRCLFANFLSDGGVYIVGDVYCDYRKFYRDGRTSFIDFVRALIDAMHAHYQVTTSETNFQVGHPDRIREVSVPAITPILGAIEIYDSLVVVRRATRGLTRSIHRT
jgi:hypothetical protein